MVKISQNQDDFVFINPPGNQTPKNITLILHGLNLKPERMDGWADELAKAGSKVLRMGLSGHNGHRGDMSDVSAKIWRENFAKNIKLAFSEAKKLGVPVNFLGFSLGALIGLDWLSRRSDDQESFHKLVLIAPAINIPWYTKGVRIFSIFGRDFLLPSRSPRSYQANRGTSVAAYEALIELKEDLEKTKFAGLNHDALILVDKHDELVSAQKIKEIIRQYNLPKWQLHLLDNRFAHDNFGFRHLVIDKESVGKTMWQKIVAQVNQFFSR